MMAFTFYLHDGLAAMPKFLVDVFPDDDSAIAYGENLLDDRPRYTTVEIMRGLEMIAVVRSDQP